jgi:hypothetical protein
LILTVLKGEPNGAGGATLSTPAWVAVSDSKNQFGRRIEEQRYRRFFVLHAARSLTYADGLVPEQLPNARNLQHAA